MLLEEKLAQKKQELEARVGEYNQILQEIQRYESLKGTFLQAIIGLEASVKTIEELILENTPIEGEEETEEEENADEDEE